MPHAAACSSARCVRAFLICPGTLAVTLTGPAARPAAARAARWHGTRAPPIAKDDALARVQPAMRIGRADSCVAMTPLHLRARGPGGGGLSGGGGRERRRPEGHNDANCFRMC
jgi:hypothetical protein